MPKKEERELFDKAVTKKMNNYKPTKFIIFILLITLLLSIFNFMYNLYLDNTLYIIINSLLLLLFNIVFISLIFRAFIKKRGLILLGSLLLIIIYVFNILINFNVINLSPKDNLLYGKDLNTLIKYSKDNNIKLEYDYEYSDMIKENSVISYKEYNNTMKVVMSLGSNPSKSINIPDMISWNDEDVLKYLEDKKLNNIKVKYINSDKLENTLINQSKKGIIKRDELLELEFSYGNRLDFNSVKLRDLTGMSLARVTMYLEKNHLNYEFIKDYSKYKKDTVFNQSIEPGTNLKIKTDTIKIYISKGKKIKMIDVSNKDINSVNEWLIKNNLIVKYEEKYDSKVAKDHVIKSNKNTGDTLTSGEEITIYLSKGKLVMKNFNTLDKFKSWASKNKIEYEEEYEFSKDKDIGEIISTSIKPGEAVNSDDVITVVVSEGKKNVMIDVVGLDKDKAIEKLENNNIKYNISYEKGNKNKVLKQSIRAGSEISKATTVSLIIGK
ncbi:MAG: PASTA domain-containing protein [Bacilli bacterium]|nr:PASTA domain-containing protein [Bacilli bacterium]